MKVYLGPFHTYVGPYQCAKLLRYLGFSAEYCKQLGARLADIGWLSDCLEWIESKRHRTVKIKLHPYDTWNVDDTLAVIILPLLQKYRDTRQGSPHVDDADVPEEFRVGKPEEAMTAEEDWQRWDARWAWVLNEMIWAFEQIVNGDSTAEFFKNTREEYLAYEQRIDRGTTLFGKYFRGLWD